MKTSLRYLITALLVVSAILAGCSPKNTPTSTPTTITEAPVNLVPENLDLSLPEAVSKDIKLDPATTQDADILAVSSLVYEGLVKLDESDNVQPALAISWTTSDDQLDYVLNLRQDVTFHSGGIFDADAVLVNFNRWFDPEDPLHGTKVYLGWEQFFLGFKGDVDAAGVAISPFDGVEKVDNFTILIHLNRPVPELLSYLAQPYFWIIDPAVLDSGADTLGTSIETVSGTGAYVLSGWTDTGLVFSPNAEYWDAVPTADVQIGWK